MAGLVAPEKAARMLSWNAGGGGTQETLSGPGPGRGT